MFDVYKQANITLKDNKIDIDSFMEAKEEMDEY